MKCNVNFKRNANIKWSNIKSKWLTYEKCFLNSESRVTALVWLQMELFWPLLARRWRAAGGCGLLGQERNEPSEHVWSWLLESVQGVRLLPVSPHEERASSFGLFWPGFLSRYLSSSLVPSFKPRSDACITAPKSIPGGTSCPALGLHADGPSRDHWPQRPGARADVSGTCWGREGRVLMLWEPVSTLPLFNQTSFQRFMS